METRPTSDKVRDAIFNMLGDCFVGERVLDLFAGTGAMGIEAVSRGAGSAVFVESRAPVCQVIRDNLRHTHLEDETHLLCIRVERALAVLEETFALVLVDPPYGYPNLHGIMASIGAARVVGSDTRVVFEHTPRFLVEDRYARLVLHRQKVYGDTAVSIFVVQEEQKA